MIALHLCHKSVTTYSAERSQPHTCGHAYQSDLATLAQNPCADQALPEKGRLVTTELRTGKPRHHCDALICPRSDGESGGGRSWEFEPRSREAYDDRLPLRARLDARSLWQRLAAGSREQGSAFRWKAAGPRDLFRGKRRTDQT